MVSERAISCVPPAPKILTALDIGYAYSTEADEMTWAVGDLRGEGIRESSTQRTLKTPETHVYQKGSLIFILVAEEILGEG